MNDKEKRQQAEQYCLDLAEIVENIADTLKGRKYNQSKSGLNIMEGDVYVIGQLKGVLDYANRFKSLVITK